jgi:ubiquinone/menaquinone biosynthesis C-methylase UbiE
MSRSAEPSSREYVPALSLHRLTPLYDPLIRLMLRERTLKQRLIDQAGIQSGHAVLDVGCGTGTLAIMIKTACPGARVVGLDGDPQILEIARKKLAPGRVDVEFVEGMAYAPPFAPESFDRVVTTLMLHHLTNDEKRRTLTAIRGLLRPGGELHIADWGRPHNALMQVAALSFRLFDGGERTALHVQGKLPALVQEAGFVAVRETHHAMTPFGTLSFIRADTGLGRLPAG